jgi:hypothetical protein
MELSRVHRVLAALTVLGLGAGTAQAWADVYMTQKVRTDAFQMMGQSQPAKEEVMTMWLAANKARTDMRGGAASMIFLPEKKLLFMIDHTQKQYREMPMDLGGLFGQMAGQEAADSGEAEAMAGLMKTMLGNMSARVTETGEAKMIGAWHCRRYLIEMTLGLGGTTSAEAWASEDIKVDSAMAFAMANAMMASVPGFEKIVAEMKKIKGVIVAQTATAKVMGAEVRSTTELLECQEKAAPDGTYDIPAGYTKVKGGITG